MINIVRFARTVRYLRKEQIYFRLYYAIKKPKIPKSNINCFELAATKEKWHSPCFVHGIVQPNNSFVFLNESHNIENQLIWNNPKIAKLWLYNLHYFSILQVPSHEYSNLEKIDLINRWINENKTGSEIGWEPYPTSLRIVNWIKFLLNCSIKNDAIFKSLLIQTKALNSRLEYHLLGNHLLANAKALIFSGLYFKHENAKNFYQKGLSLFLRELNEQILGDGGHFELSPMYHALILEDLLDLMQLHQLYQKEIPKNFYHIAYKMLCWLQTMTHMNGEPAFFNDTALKISQNYKALVGYASILNVKIPENFKKAIQFLKYSGYYRLQNKNVSLICDLARVGPNYLPGHAHADTLSFEFSIGSQLVFVNSGISCYGTSEQRYAERSTSAHNTVVIDKQNSSEVWSGFRVGRRAKVFDIIFFRKDRTFSLRAKHNGYSYLSKNIIHERQWHLQDHQLHIKDIITGNKEHFVEAIYHLHPNLYIEAITNNMLKIFNDRNQLLATFTGNKKIMLIDTYYYPEFGKKIPNKSLVIIENSILPIIFEAKIEWTQNAYLVS